MTIGDLIRQERERRALSKSDLARLSGVTPPVITRIENGENVPKISTVVAIARALGIEPGYFLAALALKGDEKLTNGVAGASTESAADYIRMAQRILADALEKVEKASRQAREPEIDASVRGVTAILLRASAN